MGDFRQTSTHSTFVKISLYEYVYVRAVHKSFQYNFTFSIKGDTSELAQSQFQPYYKLHSRFLRFRKFRLVISSTLGVMFNSFKPCLHFVGSWQTVQIHIRRHITTVASDLLTKNLNKKKTPKTTPESGYELVQKIKMGKLHSTCMGKHKV